MGSLNECLRNLRRRGCLLGQLAAGAGGFLRQVLIPSLRDPPVSFLAPSPNYTGVVRITMLPGRIRVGCRLALMSARGQVARFELKRVYVLACLAALQVYMLHQYASTAGQYADLTTLIIELMGPCSAPKISRLL